MLSYSLVFDTVGEIVICLRRIDSYNIVDCELNFRPHNIINISFVCPELTFGIITTKHVLQIVLLTT